MELLAPVGTEEALKAAIAGGGRRLPGRKSFGARHFASNFSDQQLAGAIGLAHDHGMRAYVTVNTLIKEGRWPMRSLSWACSIAWKRTR